MRRLLPTLVAIFLALFLSSQPGLARPHGGAALVIADGESSVDPQRQDDVLSIARSLEDIGFDTQRMLDNTTSVEAALGEFLNRANHIQHIVLYYAGSAIVEPHDIVLRIRRPRSLNPLGIRELVEKFDREQFSAFIFLDLCVPFAAPLAQDLNSMFPHLRGFMLSVHVRTEAECAAPQPRDSYGRTLARLLREQDLALSDLLGRLDRDMRGPGDRAHLHTSRLRSDFYFAPTARRQRELATLAEHTRNAIGFDRKRRTGFYNVADLDESALAREVAGRSLSYAGIRDRLQAIDPAGATAALLYGSCASRGQRQSVCATVIKASGIDEVPLTATVKDAAALAQRGRRSLRVRAAGLDRSAAVSRYLARYGGGEGTVAASPPPLSPQAAALCTGNDLDCIGRLVMPAKLQAALQSVRHLVVVPIGSIGAIPFGALPFGDGVLIDEMTVTIAPGLDALMKERGRGLRELSGKRLVVGDPDLSAAPHFIKGRLGGALEEAKFAAQTFGGELLAGKDATHDGVSARLREHAADLSVIYLATHGLANQTDPMDKSVLLLRGKDLTGRAIKDLKLANKPIVIMSACQTGLGKVFSAGVFGLAQAWLEAGAGTVLMSLWDVDDAATLSLMSEFIVNFNGGDSPQTALRKAILKLKSNERFQHPRFWAGFVVFGPPA